MFQGGMSRTSAVLILILFLGCGSWAYLYGVLDPYWRAQRRGAIADAYHSDFYPRWLGTRLALTKHADPYGDSVTRQIQSGVYGHPVDPASNMDPQLFVYPAQVIILIAPLAMLPLRIASPIFSIILFAMALSLVPLFMLSLGQSWSHRSKWIGIVTALASLPLAQALYVQQFAVSVLFAIAAGCACLVKRRLVLAGILFSLSTIKPQLSVLLLGWLFIWCIARWRTRFPLLISLFSTTAILVLSPELLVSGWLQKWLAAISAYRRYPNLKIAAAWLLPDSLAQLVTIVALVAVLILVWRFRNDEPGETKFGLALALVLAATLLIIPIWPAFQYNQILLIPAVLVIAHAYNKELSRTQRFLSQLVVVVLGFSSAGALFVSTAVLVFGVRIEQLGHSVELPLFNFAVAPLITLAAMIGVAWEAMSRRVPSPTVAVRS